MIIIIPVDSYNVIGKLYMRVMYNHWRYNNVRELPHVVLACKNTDHHITDYYIICGPDDSIGNHVLYTGPVTILISTDQNAT